MPLKSKSNQGDNDSVLSVVDPVKPKTVYCRCTIGFTLAWIMLLITGAWLAVNVGIACISLYAISRTKVCTISNSQHYSKPNTFYCRGMDFGYPVGLFGCVQGFGICQCFEDPVTKVIVWTTEIQDNHRGTFSSLNMWIPIVGLDGQPNYSSHFQDWDLQSHAHCGPPRTTLHCFRVDCRI